MIRTCWDRVRRRLARERYEHLEHAHASVDRDARESLDRAQRGIRRNPFH